MSSSTSWPCGRHSGRTMSHRLNDESKSTAMGNGQPTLNGLLHSLAQPFVRCQKRIILLHCVCVQVEKREEGWRLLSKSAQPKM
jgi:hypothetical protein